MLVLCQKLHIICTYNRSNFSGDWPPSVTAAPNGPQTAGAITARVRRTSAGVELERHHSVHHVSSVCQSVAYMNMTVDCGDTWRMFLSQ